MAVVTVPRKGFRHELQQPTPSSNVGGYVTLLDSAGRNVPGKQVLLDVAIHEGHHHLRKVAEHVNEKIRELLDRWGGDEEVVPEVRRTRNTENLCLRRHLQPHNALVATWGVHV